jgi:hypothetical protein
MRACVCVCACCSQHCDTVEARASTCIARHTCVHTIRTRTRTHTLDTHTHNACAGFLGKAVHSGAVTTLGRGGSDLTATLVGAALDLPEVQVRACAVAERTLCSVVGYACGPVVRACVRVCARVCVRECARGCVLGWDATLPCLHLAPAPALPVLCLRATP